LSEEYFQLPKVLEAVYSVGASEKDCHTAQHTLALNTEPSIANFQP